MFLLAVPVQVFAAEEVGNRTEVLFEIDEKGKPHPEVFIPFRWTENAYSGIGYSSTQSSKVDKLESFSESRVATTHNETNLKLNLYTHEWKIGGFIYSLGGVLDYLSIERLEFGYVHFPINLGGEWVALDNEVEIEVIKPVIQGIVETTFGEDLSVRSVFDFSPTSRLSVDQETRFKPIVEATGKKHSSSQNMTYKIGLEVLYRTGLFIDIGVVASHEFLPLKYDIAILDFDSTNSSFSFKASKIDIEERTNKITLMFLFNKMNVGGMHPAVGIGYERITSKDIIKAKSKTEDEYFIITGFEKRF